MKKITVLMLTLICLSLLSACESENKNKEIVKDEIVSDAYNSIDLDKDSLFSDRDIEENSDLSGAVIINAEDNSDYVINAEGIYILTGSASNFTVCIEAACEDKVELVLQNVEISNDDFPVIYVKAADKCFIVCEGDNTLAVTGEFAADNDTNTDAVIFSKDDLTLKGKGSLTINSPFGNGITSKDDLKITGGKYVVYCKKDGIEANDSISIYAGEFVIDTQKDAFHCENDEQLGGIYVRDGSFKLNSADDGIQATTYLVIDGGEFDIEAEEGLEATFIQINGGKINICANDDGINAARKSNACDIVIEINDGDITIVMAEGDTDGIDSNGIIIINGGTVDVTGNSTFDYDIYAEKNGGTIIINGVVTDEIPVSMMGGHGQRGDFDFSDGQRKRDEGNEINPEMAPWMNPEMNPEMNPDMNPEMKPKMNKNMEKGMKKM